MKEAVHSSEEIRSVPFHRTVVGDEALDYVAKVLASGWLTTGRYCTELEERLKDEVNVPHTLAVSSATAGFQIILAALDLPPTSAILFPTMTFGSPPAEALHAGLKVRFADIDPKTLNVTYETLSAAHRQDVRAVCVTHMAGVPCDMEDVYRYAGEHDVVVIEDAAHAMPSSYKGRPVGSDLRTTATFFSFYATKTVAAGEGGAVVTHDPQLYKKMYRLRLHGFDRDAFKRYQLKGREAVEYDIVAAGFKANMSDLHAALALGSLEEMYTNRRLRREIADRYDSAFSSMDTPGWRCEIQWDDRESSYHLYMLYCVGEEERDSLINRLSEHGIGTSIHFKPVHKHSFWKTYLEATNQVDTFEEAEWAFERIVSLPIYPSLSKQEQAYVVKHVLEL